MKRIIFTTILALTLSISAFAQTEKSPCPMIEVEGGGVVNVSDPMTFWVKSNVETKSLNLEYEWTVSEGKISEGQNSASVKVETTGLSDGMNITATVKIKGLRENCATTASETGSVTIRRIIGEPLEYFGKLPNNEVKARMDALFVALGNEPNTQGYILNYGTDREIAVREKQIQKAIVIRKYDASRMLVVKCGAKLNGKGVWTKVWLIFPETKIEC